jgi:hypothetical protein
MREFTFQTTLLASIRVTAETRFVTSPVGFTGRLSFHIRARPLYSDAGGLRRSAGSTLNAPESFIRPCVLHNGRPTPARAA